MMLLSSRRGADVQLLLFDQRHGPSGTNGLGINSFVDLLANFLYFIDHAQTIACVIARSVKSADLVIPAHGNFTQPQSSQLRHVQQFDVETKAVDRGCFNDRPASAHSKCFETTLGVPKRQPCCESHDQVKYAAALFSPPWLVHPNEPAIERARAE